MVLPVRAASQRTIRPSRSDVLGVGGELRLDPEDARARVERADATATPLDSPPPPIGISTAARSGTSSAISSPTVPWPAMIRSSS